MATQSIVLQLLNPFATSVVGRSLWTRRGFLLRVTRNIAEVRSVSTRRLTVVRFGVPVLKLRWQQRQYENCKHCTVVEGWISNRFFQTLPAGRSVCRAGRTALGRATAGLLFAGSRQCG